MLGMFDNLYNWICLVVFIVIAFYLCNQRSCFTFKLMAAFKLFSISFRSYFANSVPKI